MRNCKITGFTLIELLVVIAIISILIAVAMPSYLTYTRRAHYVEVIQAAAPYKLAVEECYEITNEIANCNSDNHNVPAAFSAKNDRGLVDTVSVNQGVVTVTPKQKFGINPQDTYVLTPNIQQERLIWTASGGGVAEGYAS